MKRFFLTYYFSFLIVAGAVIFGFSVLDIIHWGGFSHVDEMFFLIILAGIIALSVYNITLFVVVVTPLYLLQRKFLPLNFHLTLIYGIIIGILNFYAFGNMLTLSTKPYLYLFTGFGVMFGACFWWFYSHEQNALKKGEI
ncbi:hypothetical protein [Bartonella sp. HY038]|uniref:hypothetical protein n=1 Tax=Bartonella sp. HY038 TaxID=2759660 RepID=UPI0015FA24A4|nr:hypothetical protein [Bartonella sp. HY038]